MEPADLANFVDQVPERYVPGLMRGELVEAEHVGRYLWAAQLGRGKRVLDAGCGMGYGCALLADAGAAEVIGVDIAPAVIDAAAAAMPDRVQLQVADVRSLPFSDEAFDLVVCFEVVEHVEDPVGLLGELARVLAAGGILMVSSPNREVYPPGNPHHLRELTPAELEVTLARHFREVRLVGQHSWNASRIGGAASGTDAAPAPAAGSVYTTTELSVEGESYALAVATNGVLPELEDLVVLGTDLEFRRWLEYFAEQRRHIERLETSLVAAETAANERVEIRRLLLESEQQLAELPELRDLLVEQEQTIRDLTERLEELDRARITIENLKSSASWRITRPLRWAKAFLKAPEG